MNKLLIATTNPGKLHELKLFLSDLPVELVGLQDIGITDNPEETGADFRENAILKAKHYAALSGLPTLADDGGFEIDALGGAPGVKSHRWIHGDRDDTDEELITYTIKELVGVPEGKRQAQLRLVLALVLPDGREFTAEDSVRGVIPLVPASTRHAGFPYRSLLYLPEIGKFYNQDVLTASETEAYNHRKKAVEKIKPILQKELGLMI